MKTAKKKAKKNAKKNAKEKTRQAPEAAEGSRERLIAVGLRLFAQKGLDSVSVRDLAAEAGVNLSLVSYHFGGKEGLYKTIIEEHALQARERMYQAIEPAAGTAMTAETFRNTLRTIIGTLVTLRNESPEMAVLMQRERLDGLPYARTVYEDIMGPIGDRLVGFVDAAAAAGVVRSDLNTRAYFAALVESIFGYFILHDCKLKIWKDAYRLPKQNDDYIDFMSRLFTEGILK